MGRVNQGKESGLNVVLLCRSSLSGPSWVFMGNATESCRLGKESTTTLKRGERRR